jgi:hypothetical protein
MYLEDSMLTPTRGSQHFLGLWEEVKHLLCLAYKQPPGMVHVKDRHGGAAGSGLTDNEIAMPGEMLTHWSLRGMKRGAADPDSGSRASVRSDFRRLQPGQAQARFSWLDEPPRERGTMCSA